MADGWRFVVYECKDFPISSFCSQEAYKPGSQYQNMAWTLKGHCDGTLSPTATPTAFNNADCPVASAYPECTYEAGLPTPATTIPQCKYNKAVEVTGIVCNCGDSGCPTPSPTLSSCTKTEIRNSCPAVDSWSSGVSYEAGDVVRIANYIHLQGVVVLLVVQQCGVQADNGPNRHLDPGLDCGRHLSLRVFLGRCFK